MLVSERPMRTLRSLLSRDLLAFGPLFTPSPREIEPSR
jgi:hypothetical protein